jgi:hypothetical protein
LVEQVEAQKPCSPGQRFVVNYAFLQPGDTSSVTEILAAFIRQTLEKCPDLIMLPGVSSKIGTCLWEKTRLRDEQHVEVLRELWASFEAVYLILDGLHEVREETRCRLLSFFSESPENVNLFATSREPDLLPSILAPYARIDIRATREDIRYLVIDQLGHRCVDGKIFDVELERIAHIVWDAANGM